MSGPVFHHTFVAMNTRLSLVLPETDARAGDAVCEVIRHHVDRQETLMSRFSEGPLAQVNAQAAQQAVPVPRELWDILRECQHHNRLSEGLFDIAQGASAAVILDEKTLTVRFDRAGVQLDLGGIGKGVALRGVEAILRQNGVAQAFVSFGESSILAMGEHPAGGGWRVGLADGADGFRLKDEAMSVSAQTADHRHIVHPQTGEWAPYRTVAVAGACPVAAEALSTALCVGSKDQQGRIAANYPDMRIRVREDSSVSRVDYQYG